MAFEEQILHIVENTTAPVLNNPDLANYAKPKDDISVPKLIFLGFAFQVRRQDTENISKCSFRSYTGLQHSSVCYALRNGIGGYYMGIPSPVATCSGTVIQGADAPVFALASS